MCEHLCLCDTMRLGASAGFVHARTNTFIKEWTEQHSPLHLGQKVGVLSFTKLCTAVYLCGLVDTYERYIVAVCQ